jgi:hypothetical protein
MNQTATGKTNVKQPRGGRPRGLLPPRQRDEQLAVSDGKRILCTAMRINQHQIFLAAFGPEQTKIVYTFVDALRGYPDLQIHGITTTRTEEGAGSYILLGDIHGNAQALVEFGQNIQLNPWLEPVGAKVVPEGVIDLKFIAPAGRRLLLDALTVISNDYGLNIESMIHRTEGPDLLRQVARGRDLGVLRGLLLGREPGGGELGDQRHGGRDRGGGLGKGVGGTAGRDVAGRGVAGRGGGTQDVEAGGVRTGGGFDGLGTKDVGTVDAQAGGLNGLGTEDVGTGGAGADGGFDGLGTADDTHYVTVTKMRLELPQGTNLENLKRDLELVGKDWEFRWEQRRGNGAYDQLLTQRLFGGLI